MKKGLLFVAVVFAASFASCKKDYACECTVGGLTATGGTFKDTKKNAEEKCNEDDVSTGAVTVECEAVKQ